MLTRGNEKQYNLYSEIIKNFSRLGLLASFSAGFRTYKRYEIISPIQVNLRTNYDPTAGSH